MSTISTIQPQTPASELQQLTRIVFLTKHDQRLNLKEIYHLREPWAIQQALRIAQVFQQAVDPSNLRFDARRGYDLITNPPYNKGIAEARLAEVPVERQDSNIGILVPTLTQLLGEQLEIQFSQEQIEKLELIVQGAFTNLRREEEDFWIFWQHESEHKVTYNYNILFASIVQRAAPFLVAVPIGLEITVDISKEKLFWITIEERHNFSIVASTVKAVQQKLE